MRTFINRKAFILAQEPLINIRVLPGITRIIYSSPDTVTTRRPNGHVRLYGRVTSLNITDGPLGTANGYGSIVIGMEGPGGQISPCNITPAGALTGTTANADSGQLLRIGGIPQ